MSFRPLHNYVVVRPDHEDSPGVTPGGIVIPETAQERHQHNGDGVLQTGVVQAIGPGHLIRKGSNSGKYSPCDFGVGDRILYPKHQLVVPVDGKNLVIHEQHIYAVLQEA